MATDSENSENYFNLGCMFFDGISVSKDLLKSLEWFKMAANGVHPYGNYAVSCFYYYGYGVEKNIDMALEYAMKSYRQQNAKGCYILGLCYYDKNEFNTAFKYFELSSTSGYHRAEEMLAWCYYNGLGTLEIPNVRKAFLYAQRSAIKGNIESKYIAGMCSIFMNRYATAYDYLKEAASMGHRYAMNEFSCLRDFLNMKTEKEYPNKRRKTGKPL